MYFAIGSLVVLGCGVIYGTLVLAHETLLEQMCIMSTEEVREKYKKRTLTDKMLLRRVNWS